MLGTPTPTQGDLAGSVPESLQRMHCYYFTAGTIVLTDPDCSDLTKCTGEGGRPLDSCKMRISKDGVITLTDDKSREDVLSFSITNPVFTQSFDKTMFWFKVVPFVEEKSVDKKLSSSEEESKSEIPTSTMEIGVFTTDIHFRGTMIGLMKLVNAGGSCEHCKMKEWQSEVPGSSALPLFRMFIKRSIGLLYESPSQMYFDEPCTFDPAIFGEVCRQSLRNTQDSSEATALMIDFYSEWKKHQMKDVREEPVGPDSIIPSPMERDVSDSRGISAGAGAGSATKLARHWSEVFMSQDISRFVKLSDFKKVLKTYHSINNHPSRSDFELEQGLLLKRALHLGHSGFIQTVLDFEKISDSMNASTVAEQSMSEAFLDWGECNRVFLNEYLIPELGKKKTEEIMSGLRTAFVSYIKDQRSDLKSGRLDIFGLLWHYSKDSKQCLWQVLKNKCRSILDYNTLHKAKLNWRWFNQELLTHPLWIDDISLDDLNDVEPVDPSFSSSAAAAATEESKEEDESKKPLIMKKKKKKAKSKKPSGKIRYDWLLKLVSEEEKTKKGREIEMDFQQLIKKSGMEEWKSLCEWDIKGCKETLKEQRQDAVEGGPKVHQWTEEALSEVSMMSNSLEFDPLRDHDLNAYVTEMRTCAYSLNDDFGQYMKDMFNPLKSSSPLDGSSASASASSVSEAVSNGSFDIRIGPVKSEARIKSKTESDYSDKSLGYCWPFSAHVLDVIRCSITVGSITQLNQVLDIFLKHISRIHNNDDDDDKDSQFKLGIVRVKNGFRKYSNDLSIENIPQKYCDVKVNVSFTKNPKLTAKVKGTEKEKSVTIIGEVQFLLDCILKSKKKGHELYEIQRSSDLMYGAKKHLIEKNTWEFKLLESADLSNGLVNLLCKYPQRFSLSSLSKRVKITSKTQNVIATPLALIIDSKASNRIAYRKYFNSGVRRKVYRWRNFLSDECEKKVLDCIEKYSTMKSLSMGVELINVKHPSIAHCSKRFDEWLKLVMLPKKCRAAKKRLDARSYLNAYLCYNPYCNVETLQIIADVCESTDDESELISFWMDSLDIWPIVMEAVDKRALSNLLLLWNEIVPLPVKTKLLSDYYDDDGGGDSVKLSSLSSESDSSTSAIRASVSLRKGVKKGGKWDRIDESIAKDRDFFMKEEISEFELDTLMSIVKDDEGFPTLDDKVKQAAERVDFGSDIKPQSKLGMWKIRNIILLFSFSKQNFCVI